MPIVTTLSQCPKVITMVINHFYHLLTMPSVSWFENETPADTVICRLINACLPVSEISSIIVEDTETPWICHLNVCGDNFTKLLHHHHLASYCYMSYTQYCHDVYYTISYTQYCHDVYYNQ